ncbi:hypothetical protein Q2T40_14345 [Winogradskyella maritima]|uniref:Uncharacterized protein n=1 Tax=Winogradskyella maritima TaxID=1517766 RepID=A0ABV8AJA2_9FLAO|nr:hypothetical protein [Winogradskyella maritima]
MIRLYLIGLFILIIAILANGLASKLGLMSWYEAINNFIDDGTKAFSATRFMDYLWLLLLYPMLLSLGYVVGDKIYHLLLG